MRLAPCLQRGFIRFELETVVEPPEEEEDTNRQAYLSSARGTHAELVVAAKMCPSKIIHPGTPSISQAPCPPH